MKKLIARFVCALAVATALSGLKLGRLHLKKQCEVNSFQLCDSTNGFCSGRPISTGEDMLHKSKSFRSALLLFGVLSFVPSKGNAAGYEAAPSAYSPMKYLYSVPLLPQSALLNSLPIENELVAELQAYLESFEQLINPSVTQETQLEKNSSVLWTNLRINAQRAAGMFIYNRNQLLPQISESDPSNMQYLRRQQGERFLNQLQTDVLLLVNASRKSLVSESLRFMRKSLNGLCSVANMLVPLNETLSIDEYSSTSTERGNEQEEVLPSILSVKDSETKYPTVPTLVGRATVVLTFQRPGAATILPAKRKSNSDSSSSSSSGSSSKKSSSTGARSMIDDGTDRVSGLFAKRSGGSNTFSPVGRSAVVPPEKNKQDDEKAFVTLIVDGFNHPLTAGNFIDLCLRGVYDGLPVDEDIFEQEGSSVQRKIMGKTEQQGGGYRDPLTGAQRRIPLEILREGRDPRTASSSSSSGSSSSSSGSSSSSNSNEKQRGGSSVTGGGRFTATGLARNSAVFTKAEPVLSFATYGSIGMTHAPGDGNGASSSFFWVKPDRTLFPYERNELPTIQRLNNRYSLFAHVVEGNDVLELLRPGDTLLSAEVQEDEDEGVWKLFRPNAGDEVVRDD